MYRRIILAILFLGFMVCPNLMFGQDEWRKLLNGKDMEGWEQIGIGHFTVEPDGSYMTHDGLGSLNYTKESFGNIRLRVSYRLQAPQMDGGINFRIPLDYRSHLTGGPKDGWIQADMDHEIQIWNREDDLHCTGTVYGFSRVLARPYSETDWNVVELWMIGPRSICWINGVKVTDYIEGEPLDPGRRAQDVKPGIRPNIGYIGIQNHQDINNVKQFVYYKDVMVAPLPPGL